MAEDDSSVGRSLIKHLACSKKSTREKALRLILKSWLPSRSQPLSDDDAKKLWKGLFYCVWHSDKPLVQADLIHRLASLLPTLRHLPISLQYLSVFFLTIRREWSGIDRLRLDKFYLLTRRFISFTFSLLKNYSWESELVHRVIRLLDEATFSAHDKIRGGNGVNYHFASVFLEELRPFLPVKQQVLEVLFEPFITAMGKWPDKVLLGKVRSGMFDVLLENGKRLLEIKKAGGDEKISSDDDDVAVLGTIAVVMGFSGKFYELGSAPECAQGSRKVLFELHREFSKLEKDAAASGFEFSIPDQVEDDEVVPNLVPIANGVEEGDALPQRDLELAAKVLKKCKKEKKNSVDGKKKEKKKNKKKKSDASDLNPAAENDSEKAASEDGGSLNEERVNDENTISLNEAVISNLQKQFEKVAAEAGLDDGVASVCDTPEAGTVAKKRKRSKNAKGKVCEDSDLNGAGDEEAAVSKSVEKSAKKVRFSMKNNLVWKPQSPLPPLNVRIPPSVTPRGSALKKGVPPGPIREMSSSTKKMKQKKGARLIRKNGVSTISPSVKRLKKLKSRSL